VRPQPRRRAPRRAVPAACVQRRATATGGLPAPSGTLRDPPHGTMRAARSFSTADTRPDGRVWPEAIQLVDGHWAPDGTALAVADVAGQWHLYAATGAAEPTASTHIISLPSPSLLKPMGLRAPVWAAGPGRGAPASNARYDQFFASDYGALSRDAAGFVLDAETQRPPHLRSERCAGLP